MRTSIVLLAAGALLAGGGDALACGPCACGDPVASAIGIPDAEPGGGYAGLSVETARRRAGYERHADVEVSVLGGWTGERARLLFALPWVQRELVTPGPHGNRVARRTGIGDAALTGMLVLARDAGIVRGQSVHALATVTLETGRRVDGVGEELQPGAGAPSVALGAGWFGHLRNHRAYVSVLARRSLPGPEGYAAGDAWLANAGWQRSLGTRASLTLELNARHAKPDRWTNADYDVPDTGGSLLHATPGLLVAVPGGALARASVQLPIAMQLRGSQSPGPVAQLALFRTF